MKKKLKLLLVNLTILLIGCLAIELILGGWFSTDNKLNNLNIIRDKEYTYLSELYSESPIEIKYSRDKYGLRGKSTFNAPEKIDILTVGGSTTDQRYLSDGQTWQDVVERQFEKGGQNLLISNGGVDGQSTFGHIKSFEAWFPNIPDLQPKFVLFYVGINDFFLISDTGQFDELYSKSSLKKKIQTNSVFFNLYRTIHGVILSKKHQANHTRVDFSNKTYTTMQIASKELFDWYEQNLDQFEQRLTILKTQAESMGAKAVFITQPSMKYQWNAEGELTGFADTFHISGYDYNGVDYYHLLSALNKRIKKVAGDSAIVELTSLPVWKKSDFYDPSHNTPEGAEKVGKEIHKQLKEIVKTN